MFAFLKKMTLDVKTSVKTCFLTFEWQTADDFIINHIEQYRTVMGRAAAQAQRPNFLASTTTTTKTTSTTTTIIDNPMIQHQNATQDPFAAPIKMKTHVARLMRINHTGEVCAQALYCGQIQGSKDAQVRAFLEHAKIEEEAHLAWCHWAIEQLGGRSSYLNVVWYFASYMLGYLLARVGETQNLAFVHETEAQVARHLHQHLLDIERKYVPHAQQDISSQMMRDVVAVLQQMLADEKNHGEAAMVLALALQGKQLPEIVRTVMQGMSRIMTGLTYRI